MKRLLVWLIGIHLCVPAVSGKTVVQRDSIQKEIGFTDASPGGKVTVENVFGSISVKAAAAGRIRMKAERTIRAESDENLARAIADIRLDVTRDGNDVKIIVDGPFRRADGSVQFHDRDENGYTFAYDLEIEVPADAKIDLSTIDDGDITVDGTTGDFKVNNINGAIEMEGVSGSGKAYALNGDLTVTFERNPERHCTFGSLNGETRIAFRSPLSADLRFKTFNGEVFSDFPVTYLPGKGLVETGSKRGKTFYKTDKWTAVRIGDGGPSIDLDGFNGDTYILQRD